MIEYLELQCIGEPMTRVAVRHVPEPVCDHMGYVSSYSGGYPYCQNCGTHLTAADLRVLEYLLATP